MAAKLAGEHSDVAAATATATAPAEAAEAEAAAREPDVANAAAANTDEQIRDEGEALSVVEDEAGFRNFLDNLKLADARNTMEVGDSGGGGLGGENQAR